MDSLLKEDKLDLCLTPYAVLATSCSEGFVQFIRGATPLADIKSIQVGRMFSCYYRTRLNRTLYVHSDHLHLLHTVIINQKIIRK